MVTLTLPDQWAPCTLDAAISHNGLISDGDWIESKDQDPSGSVRLIQLADIGDGEFRNKSQRYMSPQKALALNCTYLKKGDVLIARMPDPLGRACLFPNINQPAVTVVDICLIRVSNESAINNRLLKYWINSPEFRSLMDQNASGTTRKRITRKKLETFEIPLPPLVEQKVIADKLDELLAQVDTLKARLDAIPAILKRFRQSVLAAAVSGKLTEEWRCENSYCLFGDFEIPTSWKQLAINDIADVKGGKRLPKGEELVSENTGFPYIRAGQLKNGTVISGSNNRTTQMYLTPNAQNQISRYTVRKGDAFLTIVGASIGDAGIIPESHDGANLTENAAKLTNYKTEIAEGYLSYWLRSEHLQHIIRLETKSAAQGKLALSRIKTLPFPSPCIAEQTEIVRRVEQFFTYADQVEQQVKNAQTRVNQLTQSILAKAFRGELTEQWRQDNPELISGDNSAAALLQRIKAERAAAKPAKKTKGRTSDA